MTAGNDQNGKMDLTWLQRRPEDCVLQHLARTSRAVFAAYDAALADSGMTGHQLNILLTLAQMGSLRAGHLAGAVGMDATTLTRSVKSLSDKGWVSSEAGTDRRIRILTLTPEGRRRVTVAAKRWEVVQTNLTETLGETVWASMTKSLAKLRHAAKAEPSRK